VKIIKNIDIAILLFALLTFSIGVGWIHSKSNNTSETLTTEEILEYIKEWTSSKGVTQIIKFLKTECPERKITETIKTFIEKKSDNLTREEKLKIILALGRNYKKDKKLQQEIFDIISANKNIEKGEIPLLFLAVKVDEKETIPDIITWYRDRDRPETIDLAKKTLEYAAQNDYAEALKKLHENGATIDAKFATKLLWAVVKENKGSKSITFLKSLGADLDAYNKEKNITILIQAIRNKNLETVTMLVNLGADVAKTSEDKSIGYPLQVARKFDLVGIEQFLRSKGAKD